MVKDLLAMQEIQVQSLGQEDLLEESMATQSSVLVWTMPWTEEPSGLQSVVTKRQTQLKGLNIQACRALVLEKDTLYVIMENNIPINDKLIPTFNNNTTNTAHIKIYLNILKYLIFKDHLILRRLLIQWKREIDLRDYI